MVKKLTNRWSDGYSFKLVKTLRLDSSYMVEIYQSLDQRNSFSHYLWLYEKGDVIGYMKLFDNTFSKYYPHPTICDVEIRQDRRGKKLSRKLYVAATKHFGQLHRTGTSTAAARKVSQEFKIIDGPGAKQGESFHKDGYGFIDWDYDYGVDFLPGMS